jgi:hypothetical protein
MATKIKTIDDLKAERAVLQAQIDLINKEITERLKKTLVQCTSNCPHGKGCGMGMEIGQLEYIQTHWYERPYSCTGGAEWHPGDGEFICLHCNHRNRLYDRPEIEKLKYLFKSVKDEYDKQTF